MEKCYNYKTRKFMFAVKLLHLLIKSNYRIIIYFTSLKYAKYTPSNMFGIVLLNKNGRTFWGWFVTKTVYVRGPGRRDTSYLSDLDETWSDWRTHPITSKTKWVWFRTIPLGVRPPSGFLPLIIKISRK